ncbi:hypothetical protein ACH4E8_23880 [Streptomyces sp. NPDC017979]|uniref:hypothetical protein n=1 Tax=Streptomyces sp. NPDC017979 TaxID=3365024 RepID=UPI0037A0EED2
MAFIWVENFTDDVYVTYARGITLEELRDRLVGVQPPLVLAEAKGWVYAVETIDRARNAPDEPQVPAIAASSGGAEVIFFSTRSWDPPSTFTYARDGLFALGFGMGCGGEEEERLMGEGESDFLAPVLEAAGIIGEDDSRYEDEDFNLHGEETIRAITDYFDLPEPPLGRFDPQLFTE